MCVCVRASVCVLPLHVAAQRSSKWRARLFPFSFSCKRSLFYLRLPHLISLGNTHAHTHMHTSRGTHTCTHTFRATCTPPLQSVCVSFSYAINCAALGRQRTDCTQRRAEQSSAAPCQQLLHNKQHETALNKLINKFRELNYATTANDTACKM